MRTHKMELYGVESISTMIQDDFEGDGKHPIQIMVQFEGGVNMLLYPNPNTAEPATITTTGAQTIIEYQS